MWPSTIDKHNWLEKNRVHTGRTVINSSQKEKGGLRPQMLFTDILLKHELNAHNKLAWQNMS
jgi:hypothetical protein